LGGYAPEVHVGLSGNFKDTSFADLLQFYSLSKQTVGVSVRLGAGDRVDGTFYFADGDLVGAKLADAEGREAIRRALRLREGAFTVEIGARPAVPATRVALRNIVLEEVGPLDVAKRQKTSAAQPTAKHAGAVASGAFVSTPGAAPGRPGSPSSSSGAPPVVKRSPTSPGTAASTSQPGIPRPGQPARKPTPQATPAQPAGGVAARGASTSSTAIPRAHPTGETARRAPATPAAAPAFKPSEPGGPGKIIAIVAVAVLLMAAGAWLVFSDTLSGSSASKAKVTARGVLDDTIVLGMVASFTGSNKERGKAMRVGWETAIGEVNEAGGIHGRKLRLVAFDDGYDPARTGPGMKEAIEGQGAFAIVGNVGTATAAVAAPYAGEHDAVFFGALSGADGLRKTPPDHHVFNFRASLASEAAAAVRYLVDVRRIDPKRIATLEQDDDFGASGRRGAIKQLASYGVPESSVLKLTYPRNTADVREAIGKLKERAADVDAVVMTATYKPAATFVRRGKDANLKVFYTTVSADSGGLAEELVLSGQGYTDDVLLTQVVPVPTSPATTLIHYRKALEKYSPGEKPGSTSLEAWIGAQIFLEALRRAGRDLDTPKLISSLESIQNLDLGIGGLINFSPTDHQGCRMVWGWLLQSDGSYKQVALE
jgi:branched-chain amino acid transport system substrate-binding protein